MLFVLEEGSDGDAGNQRRAAYQRNAFESICDIFSDVDCRSMLAADRMSACHQCGAVALAPVCWSVPHSEAPARALWPTCRHCRPI